MIIIGAKGFAKEVLEIFHQNNQLEGLAFFDNINPDIPNHLYSQFPVLKNEAEAKRFMEKNGNEFCLGIGSPKARSLMSDLFESWGGALCSVISPKAIIGHYNTTIGHGACIMSGTVITNDVCIGKGVLINLNCTIGHDVNIGNFSELSPGVHVSGHCQIEEQATLGTGAVLIPGVSIGHHSVIAAGAVVTQAVDAYVLCAGVPAVVKKRLQ